MTTNERWERYVTCGEMVRDCFDRGTGACSEEVFKTGDLRYTQQQLSRALQYLSEMGIMLAFQQNAAAAAAAMPLFEETPSGPYGVEKL